MSRAINIEATQADISAACLKHGLTISAMESLDSGGTRVVLMNGNAANMMRQAFGKRVLTGPVQRVPPRSFAR